MGTVGRWFESNPLANKINYARGSSEWFRATVLKNNSFRFFKNRGIV